MRKKTLSALIISVVIAAASLVSVSFASEGAAVVTPVTVTENYVAFASPTLIAKSAEYLVVKDGMLVRVFDDTHEEIGTITTSADGLAAYGDSIYVLTDYKLYRYKIDNGGISNAEKVTEESISSAFSDSFGIYYVNASNKLFRFDGIAPSEIAMSGEDTIKYVSGAILSAANGIIYSNKNGDIAIVTGEKKGTLIAEGLSDVKSFGIIGGKPVTLSSNGGKVVFDGKSVTATDGSTLGFYSYNDKIYISDLLGKSVSAYDVGLNKIQKLGSFGDEPDRLHSPTAIAASDGAILIADDGNKRISIYNPISGAYSVVPVSHGSDKIAALPDGFVVYSDSQRKIYIYEYKGNTYSLSKSINADAPLLDIAAWNGDVLGLKSDGSVRNFSKGVDVASLHGATALYVNYKTNILYLASETKLKRCNLLTDTSREYLHSERFSDFFVDYGGAVYFLNGKSLKRAVTDGSSLSAADEYVISDFSDGNTVALSSDGDAFFADKTGHRLLKIEANAIKAVSDKTFPAPEESEFDVVRGAELPSGTGLYTSPGNEETLITANKVTRFLALTEIENEDTRYYYGVSYANNEFYYVKKSDVTLMPRTDYGTDEPKYNSLLPTGVKVYAFPYENARIVASLDFKDVLTMLNNVADAVGSTWGWREVEFFKDGEKLSGYVRDYEIGKIASVTPPAKSQFYKVSTRTVGASAKVYSEPSDGANILFEVNDGDSVLVVEAFDKGSTYTRIYVNGAYGYILTANLIAEGLTTVQITAIIVVTVCVLALLVAVPLFVMLYKRSKHGKSEDKPLNA